MIKNEILQVLRDFPQLTLKQIQDKLQRHSEDTIRTNLLRFKDQGIVKQVDKIGKEKIYALNQYWCFEIYPDYDDDHLITFDKYIFSKCKLK
jgi:Fe2+ or Zn2+ uptake regulation protein